MLPGINVIGRPLLFPVGKTQEKSLICRICLRITFSDNTGDACLLFLSKVLAAFVLNQFICFVWYINHAGRGVVMIFQTFINFYLKIFFILTPFFVLSAFISLTRDFDDSEKRRTALKVTAGVLISSFIFFLFGRYIFELFGITLDAFRIGAGTILFLSALSMLSENSDTKHHGDNRNIAIVPLAIPMAVGPGVIGMLLVIGAEAETLAEKSIIGLAILFAVLSVGLILYLSSSVKRLIGRQGLIILPKITGLFVSAIAAQIIFTGIQNFLHLN